MQGNILRKLFWESYAIYTVYNRLHCELLLSLAHWPSFHYHNCHFLKVYVYMRHYTTGFKDPGDILYFYTITQVYCKCYGCYLLINE